MQETAAPGDNAGLKLEAQQLSRRAQRCADLFEASESTRFQRIKRRERYAEQQKERRKAEHKARVDEAVAKEEARDSRRLGDLCSHNLQLDQEIKERERQKADLTREIRQLRDGIVHNAAVTRERPELDRLHQQQMRELDEDLARFKAECHTAEEKYNDQLRDYMHHGRGTTPVITALDEASPDFGDSIDVSDSGEPDRHVLPPELSPGLRDTASADHSVGTYPLPTLPLYVRRS